MNQDSEWEGLGCGATSLVEQLAAMESRVRAFPTVAEHRWALFQLLCVSGEWERALQQLRVWERMLPAQALTAQVYRDLVAAELLRQKVFEGAERPVMADSMEAWPLSMLEALRLLSSEGSDAADKVRLQALDNAPLTACQSSVGSFHWIADSDTRLGPICEVFLRSAYWWIPLEALKSWHVRKPTHLVDLLWAPCELMLRDGRNLTGFMPARYPIEELSGDALKLGRVTHWREVGATGVFASGRKTWATDVGDFGIFELAECDFDASQAAHSQL